jgi:hypothetical protein
MTNCPICESALILDQFSDCSFICPNKEHYFRFAQYHKDFFDMELMDSTNSRCVLRNSTSQECSVSKMTNGYLLCWFELPAIEANAFLKAYKILTQCIKVIELF